MRENNPFKIFENWFDKANKADIDKPNAMTLSTVDSSGHPQARIVLLSSFDENGFVFHTNYKSEKGEHLAANSCASLLFWWDQLGFQIRINGVIEKTSASDSDDYFSKRPRGSQIGAWASHQSKVIENRQALEEKVKEYTERFTDEDVPRPPHWGGYRLMPDRFEFWVNQDSRLHDRTLFTLSSNGDWETKNLAP